MKLIKMKCPDCNATLNVDPQREFMYCEYCGTKIMLDKEEKVKRIVNEAEIRRAEAKERIEMAKLNKKELSKRESDLIGLAMIMICAALMVILLIFGFR